MVVDDGKARGRNADSANITAHRLADLDLLVAICKAVVQLFHITNIGPGTICNDASRRFPVAKRLIRDKFSNSLIKLLLRCVRGWMCPIASTK